MQPTEERTSHNVRRIRTQARAGRQVRRWDAWLGIAAIFAPCLVAAVVTILWWPR